LNTVNHRYSLDLNVDLSWLFRT